MGLIERTPYCPKRYYSQKEIEEFGADGTPWREMYEVALRNIERGNFYPIALEDVRRMGELAGLSNKRIGSGVARAVSVALSLKLESNSTSGAHAFAV